jgi:hypothetical protein
VYQPTLLTPDENAKLGSEGATTWKAGPLSPWRRGKSFVTSTKLPGPVGCQPCHDVIIARTIVHPWINRRGMAPATGLFWCTKCTFNSPNPSTAIFVANWGSLFNSASCFRQSKPSLQYLANLVTSDRGVPYVHPAWSNSGGKSVRWSF